MELRNEQPRWHNCAQTIMCAYADELGLSEDMAVAIGSNFGGMHGKTEVYAELLQVH